MGIGLLLRATGAHRVAILALVTLCAACSDQHQPSATQAAAAPAVPANGILQVAANFVAERYAPTIHIYDSAYLRAELGGGSLQAFGTTTVGQREEVFKCSRNSKNERLSRWTGEGRAGGAILEVHKIDLAADGRHATLEIEAIVFRNELAEVDFFGWRLRATRSPNAQWSVSSATLTSES